METVLFLLVLTPFFFIICQLIFIVLKKIGFIHFFVNSIQNLTGRAKVLTKAFNKASIIWISTIVQVGLINQFIMSSISRFLLRSPFWGIVTVALVYLTVYWSSLSINLPIEIFVLILHIFGFNKPDDLVTIKLISIVTNTIGVLLPISLTLYVFSYREQKAASSSGILSRDLSLICFIILATLTIPFGKQISYVMNTVVSAQEVITLSETNNYSGRIFIWGLLALKSLYFGIKMIKKTIRNVNLRWLLQDLIEETELMFVKLLFAVTKQQRLALYPILYMYIESNYQLLSIAVEKNMDQVYETNYKKWAKLLAKLQQEPRLMHVDSTVRYEYLLNKDEEYKQFYSTVLRNHIALISTLLKNHKIEGAKDAIKTFFEISPGSNILHTKFLTSLDELAIMMSKDDQIGIQPILEGLEEISRNPSIKYGLIMVYKALLVKGIDKNDVKLLSSVSYSLSKSIVTKETIISKNDIEESARKYFSDYKVPNKSVSKQQENNDVGKDFICAGIFILLKATLKSIELAHYQSTGFLTKFLVTSFESEFFNYTFKEFIECKASNTSFLEPRKEYSSINTSFHFNEKTLRYCLEKMTIILYGQQKFVMEQKINFGCVPKLPIYTDHIKCDYLDYLIEKVSKAGDKYALSFLEEKKFMEELKQHFQVPKDLSEELNPIC
ncbi:hypothetical protein [Brevibacillus laterosporus]|uniref:hypothetical protein n=1 Tax=Brevibacillus laterosporus TaxID=1465 RepID=UPI0018CF9C07|nr:hypothetical protein [Brevibacillus laterosporus]MBG9788868.1 hypothetical protein [Brevibacillus laterosporus]